MKFIIVRFDSDREISKIGVADTPEKAHDIMESDFKKWFQEKHGLMSDEDYKKTLIEDKKDNEADILETSAWLNNCNHFNFDWAIFDTESED